MIQPYRVCPVSDGGNRGCGCLYHVTPSESARHVQPSCGHVPWLGGDMTVSRLCSGLALADAGWSLCSPPEKSVTAPGVR